MLYCEEFNKTGMSFPFTHHLCRNRVWIFTSLFLVSVHVPMCAQVVYGLEGLMERAKETSSVKVAYYQYQNARLEYENYKKSFLPAFCLSLTPVNFNHSLRILQNPLNGEYYNVEDYANTMSSGVTVSQKIGLTGGTLSLNSALSVLHEFSRKTNGFSSSPVYLAYTQPLLGGYKSNVYERTIRELQLSYMAQSLAYIVASEQQRLGNLYLAAYLEKENLVIAKENLALADSLLASAEMKYRLGRITALDLNLVRASQTEQLYEFVSAENNFAESRRQLFSRLNCDSVALEVLAVELLPMKLSASSVMGLFRELNPQHAAHRLAVETAAYKSYTNKLQTRFNANISLSYGLNQYATSFSDAYKNPAQCQTVGVTFSIPVFQWGIIRNKRTIADNEQKIAALQEETKLLEEVDNVYGIVQDYNQARTSVDVLRRSYLLAEEQYRLSANQFTAGRMSANEVSLSGKEVREKHLRYLTALQSLYGSYFSIRTLSLYDFVKKRKIAETL